MSKFIKCSVNLDKWLSRFMNLEYVHNGKYFETDRVMFYALTELIQMRTWA